MPHRAAGKQCRSKGLGVPVATLHCGVWRKVILISQDPAKSLALSRLPLLRTVGFSCPLRPIMGISSNSHPASSTPKLAPVQGLEDLFLIFLVLQKNHLISSAAHVRPLL